MGWRDDIHELCKRLVSRGVLLCKPLVSQETLFFLFIILFPLIILAYILPSESLLGNFLKIVASMGGGGLLATLFSNAAARKRASHAYRAIISRLCDLSMNIYANFEYGSGKWTSSNDPIVDSLMSGAFGIVDASSEISHVRSLIREQASGMSDEEFYSVPYKQKILYNIKDLVNTYFRDAIYNTNDKTDLERLYHGTGVGLQLIGSLEGWGPTRTDALARDQLYLLDLFLEVCLPLYISLLKKRGVRQENELVIKADEAGPYYSTR